MDGAHVPAHLFADLHQSAIRFVSASDGFIFLSALFTGRIYFRLAERDGYPAMHASCSCAPCGLRYHAVLLAFAFFVAVPIAARGNRAQLHNLLDYHFAGGPKRAISEAFLLIYRPPLLDILPIYILFLLITLLALTISRRVGWSSKSEAKTERKGDDVVNLT